MYRSAERDWLLEWQREIEKDWRESSRGKRRERGGVRILKIERTGGGGWRSVRAQQPQDANSQQSELELHTEVATYTNLLIPQTGWQWAFNDDDDNEQDAGDRWLRTWTAHLAWSHVTSNRRQDEGRQITAWIIGRHFADTQAANGREEDERRAGERWWISLASLISWPLTLFFFSFYFLM